MSGSIAFRALGVECRIVATEAHTLPVVRRIAAGRLRELDAVASRFRTDSEVVRLATAAADADGRVTALVTPLLTTLLDDALWAARVTDGLVDPTLGRAMEANGYDTDLAEVLRRPTHGGARPAHGSAPSASTLRDLHLDHAAGTVTMTAGTLLDLGATAKAAAADRLAAELAAVADGGFLVDLGGDLAVAGEPPPGGWVVATGDASAPGARIVIRGHGVATSGIDRRRWRVGDSWRHHLLDPATGRSVPGTWWRVTCVAASALEANTATTAAAVLGAAAVPWLTTRAVPARLVPQSGDPVCTAGWPRSEGSWGRAS